MKLLIAFFLITSTSAFAAIDKSMPDQWALSNIEAIANDCTAFAKIAITSYFERNPNAADSVDGIHNFWIHWGENSDHISCTQAALDALELEGFVEKLQLDEGTFWRRKRL